MIAALHLPRTLFAPGAITSLAGELRALGIRHALLVTDQGLVRVGLAAKALAAVGGAANTVVFDTVNENPTFADVDAGAALYRQNGCDGVVALGGGSVIDTAKMIALLGRNPGSAGSYLGVPNATYGPAAPHIVIPTTAGTGSEVSASSGVHPDAHTPSLGINSRYLVPTVAILDPELTLSLPPRLTAATGIDALSHCIEGYLSCNDVFLANAIALDGIGRVVRNIRRAVADGSDAEARSEMMAAAYAGGVSIGMGLGPAHAIAITCSDQGFHHGVLSGIGLVATLDLVESRERERVRDVARAFGLEPSASLSRAIAKLMRELGLPSTLREMGYAANDVGTLGDAAHRSHFNRSARYHPSSSEYAAIITASLEQAP